MIVVEGFKRTGKDFYLAKKEKEGATVINYDEFGFKTNTFGSGLDNSWIVGATLSKLPYNENIYLNRGILSTAYYHNDDKKIMSYVRNNYVNDLKSNKIVIRYIRHRDRSIAHRNFLSRKSATRYDEHDEFYDFEEYWKAYREYDNTMLDYIRGLEFYGIEVEIIYNDWRNENE